MGERRRLAIERWVGVGEHLVCIGFTSGDDGKTTASFEVMLLHRVDLVVSAMAMHHVEDTGALLSALHAHLVPGGRVALADLDAEDGSFLAHQRASEPLPHPSEVCIGPRMTYAGFVGAGVLLGGRRGDRGDDGASQ